MHLPIPGVQHEASGISDILTEEYCSMGAIQFGHLYGLKDVVCPVQISTHPVNCNTLSDCHATVEDLQV